ncbi:hypothetical protein ABIC29_002776 [Agromyces sp. PvR057]
MSMFMIVLAVLAISAIASSIVDVARDGYRRVPTLQH